MGRHLFLEPPPVLLVISRLVTPSLMFSMNVNIVVIVVVVVDVKDAIFMMAVVISAGVAIEYDNMDRVNCDGK
jgi:hypothetical protein